MTAAHEPTARERLADPCIRHPSRPSRVNLDGEDLCQDCANAWVRSEGQHAAYLDAEEAAHAAPAPAGRPGRR